LNLQNIFFKIFLFYFYDLFLCLLQKQLKMAITKKNKTIQQMWVEVIKEKGLKQTWIAEQAGISAPHLSNILAERVFLTEENVENINRVLGTDFTHAE